MDLEQSCELIAVFLGEAIHEHGRDSLKTAFLLLKYGSALLEKERRLKAHDGLVSAHLVSSQEVPINAIVAAGSAAGERAKNQIGVTNRKPACAGMASKTGGVFFMGEKGSNHFMSMAGDAAFERASKNGEGTANKIGSTNRKTACVGEEKTVEALNTGEIAMESAQKRGSLAKGAAKKVNDKGISAKEGGTPRRRLAATGTTHEVGVTKKGAAADGWAKEVGGAKKKARVESSTPPKVIIDLTESSPESKPKPKKENKKLFKNCESDSTGSDCHSSEWTDSTREEDLQLALDMFDESMRTFWMYTSEGYNDRKDDQYLLLGNDQLWANDHMIIALQCMGECYLHMKMYGNAVVLLARSADKRETFLNRFGSEYKLFQLNNLINKTELGGVYSLLTIALIECGPGKDITYRSDDLDYDFANRDQGTSKEMVAIHASDICAIAKHHCEMATCCVSEVRKEFAVLATGVGEDQDDEVNRVIDKRKKDIIDLIRMFTREVVDKFNLKFG